MNLVRASEPDTEVAQFRRISIPLIRRVYPSLMASNIVAVQPLSGPSGLVFYLRHRYASEFRMPSEEGKVDWKKEGF